MDGEYSGTYARGTHLVSEMNGRYPQEEKDGYPIASHRMVAELEGVSIR